MATAVPKQELPPPGGFKPLDYSRLPARKVISGKALILGHFALTAGSLYLYSLTYKKVYKEKIEMRSSLLAITPLLLAEKDRLYLKQLRKNRDDEAELMKNVDNWNVGCLYNEPIYKTLPSDTLVSPTPQEFYAHADSKALNYFKNIILWQ